MQAEQLPQLVAQARARPWRIGWKLLRSWVVEDDKCHTPRRGTIEIGLYRLTCRACGGFFEQIAVVHGRGEVPSRSLLERRNCPLHRYLPAHVTADEVLAHELGVADLIGCRCQRCRRGLDLV